MKLAFSHSVLVAPQGSFSDDEDYDKEDDLPLSEWMKQWNVSPCLQSALSNIDEYQTADDELTTAGAHSDDDIVENIRDSEEKEVIEQKVLPLLQKRLIRNPLLLLHKKSYFKEAVDAVRLVSTYFRTPRIDTCLLYTSRCV